MKLNVPQVSLSRMGRFRPPLKEPHDLLRGIPRSNFVSKNNPTSLLLKYFCGVAASPASSHNQPPLAEGRLCPDPQATHLRQFWNDLTPPPPQCALAQYARHQLRKESE